MSAVVEKGTTVKSATRVPNFFFEFFFFYFSFLAEETQRYIGHQCIPATKSYLQEAKKRLG